MSEVLHRGIGWAVKMMRDGNKVRRQKWDSHRWIELQIPDEHSKMTLPYVFIHTVSNLVPWSCPHTDLLATDWELAKEQ